MRLLFIIHSLKFGGTERQLVELLKGLSKTLYEIHLICIDKVSNGYMDQLANIGVDVIYFNRACKYDFKPILHIYRYIKKKKIDLIHTFENLGGIFGLTAAKISSTPVVSSAIRDGIDKNFKLKLSKIILANFSNIIVSNSKAGFINRFSKIKSNFRVVYNGFDFNRLKTNVNALDILKQNPCLSRFKNIIGMVASLTERKDQETLIKSSKYIFQSVPDTCIVFVGDGERRNDLIRKVQHLGFTDKIFFLGLRDDVDILYKIFTVSVLLTNTDFHLEGISNSITESMAAGVPVIASKGGGTDELIIHGINGILVPPKDPKITAKAIIEVLKDEEKGKILADFAYLYVKKKFNLQKYISQYEDIYKELTQLSGLE